jgi:hypothetical protein
MAFLDKSTLRISVAGLRNLPVAPFPDRLAI